MLSLLVCLQAPFLGSLIDLGTVAGLALLTRTWLLLGDQVEPEGLDPALEAVTQGQHLWHCCVFCWLLQMFALKQK